MAILNYKGKLKDAVNHFEWFWYILKCLDFIYRYFLNSHLVVSNLTWRLFHQRWCFITQILIMDIFVSFQVGYLNEIDSLVSWTSRISVGFKGVIGLFRVPPEDWFDRLHILQSDDRAWHLESARFSGCKRCLGDPDQTLVTLLSKLSNDLQELLCFGKRFQCVLWILWWGCRFWMCFAWLLNSAACASPNNAKDTKYEYHVCTSCTCILYLCWNCTSFASTSLPLVGLQALPYWLTWNSPFVPYSSGLLHQRLGGLPNIWQHRENLKSLELTLGSAAGAIKYGTYNKNESRWLCKRRLVD